MAAVVHPAVTLIKHRSGHLAGRIDSGEGLMLFQLVRLEISDDGLVHRQETEPLFELREDALAMAEFEAIRCYDECEFDPQSDCWTARDSRGQTFKLVVEPIALEKAA